MKRLLILAVGVLVLVLGCADDTVPTAPGIGGPTPPGGFGGSGGSAGTGGTGGDGGAGGEPEPRGACDNSTDLAAIEAAAQNLRDIASACGASLQCGSTTGISEQYGECVTDCVEVGVDGLSTECASCYGDLERCGLESFCRPQCQVNTCGTLCNDCLYNAGCIDEYERCRGLPGNSCSG